jgi:predicted HAD superfamily Cof-like phosphohydrolase
VISQFQVLVANFNKGVGQRLHHNGFDEQKMIDLRVKLIDEEVNETVVAMKAENAVAVIDGLCDVLYVTYGAADVYDFELDTLLAEERPANARSNLQTMEGPDWRDIHDNIVDFLEQTERTLEAIKKYDKKDMQRCLQYLARGCWHCATQSLRIDMRPFFREVHRTNMWKLKGPKREDGKQLKPEGWKPPRIETMYNRLIAGNPPACTHFDEGVAVAATPHPQGGHFCMQCGGLFVDWMEAS